MVLVKVKIDRDVEKNPNLVTITEGARKLLVTYDGNNMTFSGSRSLMPTVPDILQMAYPYELESQARPDWYDRNPSIIVAYFRNDYAGPQAITTRDTYTVPENRQTMVESIFMTLERSTVGVGPDMAYVTLRYTPFNGAAYYPYEVRVYNVAQYSYKQVTGAPNFVMLPGDQIALLTYDASTDGTFFMQGSFKATEYDR